MQLEFEIVLNNGYERLLMGAEIQTLSSLGLIIPLFDRALPLDCSLVSASCNNLQNNFDSG